MLRLIVRILLGSSYASLGDCSIGKSIGLFFKLMILRAFLLTGVIVLALALPARYLFGATVGDIRLVTIPIVAILEEQSRWIFARSHERVMRSQVIFCSLVVAVETLEYYPHHKGIGIEQYLHLRIPATLLHVIASIMCVIYYKVRWRSRWKLAIPLLVIMVHAAFNMNAFDWVNRWAGAVL
jgi:hypothetical protein